MTIDYPSIVMQNVPDWVVQTSAPMTITVALRTQYGQPVIVPLCERGQLFAQIAGTKTLTRGTVELVKKLGYTVLVKNETPERL